MHLSKTDFLDFIQCSKSVWLRKNQPSNFPYSDLSEYDEKIISDGEQVETCLTELLTQQADIKRYFFQSEIQSARGLYARLDVRRNGDDGTINIYEVKSSTSVKNDRKHNHIRDIGFQKIVAEDAGLVVKNSFIIHLNGNYVRDGNIDPKKLFVFANVSSQVAKIETQIRLEIDAAIEFLKHPKIDESSCSCLMNSRSNRCKTFGYFNPKISEPSIYSLPRISASKLQDFVSSGRFSLGQISPTEVTNKQKLVLASAHSGQSVINKKALEEFFSRVEYPICFIDYETYSSAIPIIDGVQPHAPIPFQYSLHLMKSEDDIDPLHSEFLSNQAELPIKLINSLKKNISTKGSIISWHASFENTQNKSMAAWYPEHSAFLNEMTNRTLDLEDVFKEGFVDIAFGGSTSIKKVLPILAPELSYGDLEVSNGTDAMEAWHRLIYMPTSDAKELLRTALLEYCKLDTLAMVRIFEKIRQIYKLN